MITYDKKITNKLITHRRVTASGCWEYTRYITKAGYGQMYYIDKLWLVHRLAFKMFKPEKYSEFMQVNHKCDNRACFNPEHLYAGTQSDNRNDAIERNRWQNQNANKRFCINGHEFTIENTYYTPDCNHRHCRACKNSAMIFRRSIGRAS